MPVPLPLDLDAFRSRVDVTKESEAGLLTEMLEEAFEQAQAPWPNGCGRLLDPNPALVSDEEDPPSYEDSADPVTLSWTLAPDERLTTPRVARVHVPDAREITAVAVDGDAVPSTGTGRYRVFRHRGHIVQLTLPDTYWGREVTVEVTGRFGFHPLPVSLRGAIYTLAARMWHERDQQFSDQLPVAEGAPAQTYYRQLPPRVKMVFASFRVPDGVGGLA